MHAKAVLAVTGALFAAVSAVPMNKRDVVYETEIDQYYTTVGVTTTVWVDADPTDTPATDSSVDAVPTSWSEPAPAVPIVTSSSTSVVPVVTSSSTPEVPTTSSTPAPAPTSTSTSVEVPSVVPTTSSVPTTTTSSAAAASSSSTSSSSGGSQYSGDITYYDVGLGSCGTTNTDTDMVVALAAGMMQKSYCGKSITISHEGSTHEATIVDTCPGCAGAGLDLSPSLFKAVAPDGDGRVHDVAWWFSS